MEGSCEGSDAVDDVNKDEVSTKNFRGLSDIEEYDNDELPHEYYSEDDEILKDDFQIFKLSKRIEDYKWEVGTYFSTNKDFKEVIRTYDIHFRKEYEI